MRANGNAMRMVRTAAVAVLATAAGVVLGTAARPAGAAAADPPPLTRTYCPTTSPGQTIDIYQPTPVPVAAPAVMFIHGGGWETGGSGIGDSGYFRQVKQALLADGFVVASVNYRLAPQFPFPAQIVDVKCALRYLNFNASMFGIDPNRIGLLGSSAGGHLAALAGTADSTAGFDCGQYSGELCSASSAVVAVASEWGANDLTTPGWNPIPSNIIGQVFGEAPGVDSPALQTASPTTYVSANDPPFLLVQGDEDPTNLPDADASFAARLGLAGIPLTVINVHAAKHDPHEPNQEPRTADIISQVVAFLVQDVAGTPGTGGAPPAVGTVGPWPTATVDPDLRAASCVDGQHCMVAGSDGGTPVVLATTDAGAHWNVQPLPTNRGYLHAIDCVNASVCYAVGWVDFGADATGTVYATTNGGSTWSQTEIASTIVSNLNSVSCVDATHCVAVGDVTSDNLSYTAVALVTSDGVNWQAATGVPTDVATLTSISCLDTNHCWTSGLRLVDATTQSYQGVVVVKTGSTWQVQTALSINTSLEGIACVATSTCRAVGSSWDGTTTTPLIIASTGNGTWTPEPVPAGVTYLDGVVCTDVSRCWAAGYLGTGPAAGAIVVARVGGAWTTQLAGPTGSGYLLGIACATTTSCTAVGFQTDGGASAGHIYTTTDGTTWTSRGSGPAQKPLSLTGAACWTTLACLAVGNNDDGSVGVLSTADGGSTWTAGTTPTGLTRLSGITCPSTQTCLVTGAKVVRSNGKLISQAMVAKTANGGGSWNTHTFAATTASDLTAVACPSASVCVIVGDVVATPGATPTAVILVTTDGGVTWTLATVTAPPPYLGAVSCATTLRCWAAGQASGPVGMVYASSDGAQTWAAQFTDTGSVRLDGLSCPSTQSCVAVGDTTGGTARILGYNGSTWTAQSVASGANAGALAAVSCATAGSCTAVGTSTSAQTGPVVVLRPVAGVWTPQPVPSDAPSLRTVTCSPSGGQCLIAGDRILTKI